MKAKFTSHVAQYEKECVKATKECFREAGKVVARRARELAPRAINHRTDRTYPGGRKYTGERRISQSIYYRVKDPKRRLARGASIYAMIGVKVGYSVFVEYGTKYMKSAKGALSFTRRALTEKMDQIMPILKGKWPK